MAEGAVHAERGECEAVDELSQSSKIDAEGGGREDDDPGKDTCELPVIDQATVWVLTTAWGGIVSFVEANGEVVVAYAHEASATRTELIFDTVTIFLGGIRGARGGDCCAPLCGPCSEEERGHRVA